jgi:hypothetical protein
VDATHRHPYSDTPSPKRLGLVTPLDPEIFLGIDEFADELLKGVHSGKYSPAWVAAQLDDAAENATTFLRRARRENSQNAEFRRLAVDTAIQAGLGKFFAAKFRAGVLFAIYLRTGYSDALKNAIAANHAARTAWAELAAIAKGVYRDDVTFGPEYFQRGHWLDRLPAMDEDIADMEKLLTQAGHAPSQLTIPPQIIEQAIRAASARPSPHDHPSLAGLHTPPLSFRRGQPLTIVTTVPSAGIHGVGLRYRHVNQSEHWQTMDMVKTDTKYSTDIAAEYTDSPFPLQYHFQIRAKKNQTWLYPGLNPGWQGQPYFVVRQG